MDNWASQFALGYIAGGMNSDQNEQLARQASANVGNLLFGRKLGHVDPQVAELVNGFNRLAAEHAALQQENAALRAHIALLESDYAKLRAWADEAEQKLAGGR